MRVDALLVTNDGKRETVLKDVHSIELTGDDAHKIIYCLSKKDNKIGTFATSLDGMDKVFFIAVKTEET